MRRLTCIVFLLVCLSAVPATASAQGKPSVRCVHHRHRSRCAKHRTRCTKRGARGTKHQRRCRKTKKQRHARGQTDMSSGSTGHSAPTLGVPVPPTALIVHFVSTFALPDWRATEPSPLSGEISIYNGDQQLVIEQQTTEGEVVAGVVPGSYRVTVAWLQGQAPCNEKEVSVAENQQLQVSLECVMN